MGLTSRLRRLRERFATSKSAEPNEDSDDDPLYPTFPPPPPEEILNNREEYAQILFARKHLAPRGQKDTPLFCLYRLYEYIVLDDHIGLRNELEYFFRNHRWPVCDIPDPRDHKSPSRYAVLACIPDMMVDAFNNSIGISLHRDAPSIMTYEDVEACRKREERGETVPEWTVSVSPLQETLKIPHVADIHDSSRGYRTLDDLDDNGASEFFTPKNILILQPHHLFTGGEDMAFTA